jgi:hypothetical protein
VLPQALAIGIGLLAVGVVIAVLGARLVRPVVTIAFALAGVWLASRFASQINLPVPVTLALVALLVGGFGYVLHRLWVGLFIAAMSAVVALSAFGYRDILPEVPVFQEFHASAAADDTDLDFTLLTPDEQLAYNHPSPETWARDFWAHLSSRHADIRGKMAVIGVGAALAGLLIGLVATRGALIVCTALLGTSLVMSGLSLVVSRTAPEVHASALERPELLAGACVGLLATSIVIQGLLNRRPPDRPVLEPNR